MGHDTNACGITCKLSSSEINNGINTPSNPFPVVVEVKPAAPMPPLFPIPLAPVGGRLLLPGNADKILWLFGLLDITAALLALLLALLLLPALPTRIGLDIPIGVDADVTPSRLLPIAVAGNGGVDDREVFS